jgi:hypothetical protein
MLSVALLPVAVPTGIVPRYDSTEAVTFRVIA